MFPVLLLIIMSVVQFGLWYHAAAVAKAAVAEGVRAARAEGATAADGVGRHPGFPGPGRADDRRGCSARRVPQRRRRPG